MARPVPVPPAPHNANTDLSFGFARCVENFSVDLLAIDGVLENSRSHGRLRVYMRRRRPTVLWCTLYCWAMGRADSPAASRQPPPRLCMLAIGEGRRARLYALW